VNTAVMDKLNVSRRDALMAYYLGHHIPKKIPEYATKIRNDRDLYEYLLIDPGVSPAVKTSKIAEAISSVQLYIHRCLEQLEPGVEEGYIAGEAIPGGYFEYWDRYYKRYSYWAGLKRLLTYPSSYLEPSLRYSKTALFQNLEQRINQGRLTNELAEQAITGYLSALQPLLDIRYVSGYQSEPHLRNSRLYFLGKASTEPAQYYWREVSLLGNNAEETLQHPLSWSEWRHVEIPFANALDYPAIFTFEKRVHIAWVTARQVDAEVVTNAKGNQSAEPIMAYWLCISSLGADNQWQTREYKLSELIHFDIVSEPDRVFAAELRAAEGGGEGESVLGVFFVKKNNGNTSRYLVRLGKYLQPLDLLLDAPANRWDFDFRYEEKIEGSAPNQHIAWRTHCPLRHAPAGLIIPIGTELRFPLLTLMEFTSTFDGERIIALRARLGASVAVNISADFRLQDGETIKANGSTTIKPGDSHVAFSIVATPSQIGGYGNARLLIKIGVNSFQELPFSVVEKDYVTDLHPGSGSEAHIYLSVALPTNNNYTSLYLNSRQCDVFNTLAGPLLHSQAQNGLDSLLSWNTQQVVVDPDNPSGTNVVRSIPYGGGVGQYTWELFFHIPLLIAKRFLTDQRFDEAERWFKFLFNPAGYRNEQGELHKVDDKVRYWNVRPLQEDDAWNEVDIRTIDPDVIAMADPMHYKLAVYLGVLDLLQARGDMSYRRLERDTLTEAKMWYVQALALLGPRPYIPLSREWNNPELGPTVEANSAGLRAFESQVDLANLPLPLDKMAAAPFLRQIDSPFKPPFNDELLDYWGRFEGRLYNLRHNLSIDGQPLNLPLFATPVSPRAIQQMQSAGEGSGEFDSGRSVEPPQYRFEVLLARAQTAAERLRDFGNELGDILDRRDEEAMTVLQQEQADSLFALIAETKDREIDSLRKNRQSLEEEKARAVLTREHYSDRYDDNWHGGEIAAMTLNAIRIPTLGAAIGSQFLVAALNGTPTIFGLATGGMFLGSATEAVTTDTFELTSEIHGIAAEMALLHAEVDHRRREWGLLRDQAAKEEAEIQHQIDALDEEIEAAENEKERITRESKHSQIILHELRSRFSSIELFDWLDCRLSSLYYQFYDLVHSVCRQAQRSAQWEMDDPTEYLLPGAWEDRRKGLLAGQTLLLGLQRTEQAYADWNTRALQVEKTLPLGKLYEECLHVMIENALDDGGREDPDEKLVHYDGEENILDIQFDLADFSIDQDYPAQLGLSSRRLIRNLSITFKGTLDEYQDVLAVLIYRRGIDSLPSGNDMIVLSRLSADPGLFGRYVLDFEEDHYYPFEGLPISRGAFTLRFPHAKGDEAYSDQETFLRSLEEVIVHLRYQII
jgi:hypothetical protein